MQDSENAQLCRIFSAICVKFAVPHCLALSPAVSHAATAHFRCHCALSLPLRIFTATAHFRCHCAFSLPLRIFAALAHFLCSCALSLPSSALPCVFSLPHARILCCPLSCLPLPSTLPLMDSQNLQVRKSAALLAQNRRLPLPSAGVEQKTADQQQQKSNETQWSSSFLCKGVSIVPQ